VKIPADRFARRVEMSQPSLLIKTANHRHLSRHPVPQEGRIMIVATRWVRDAMDAAASGTRVPTNDANADGEVVWS
jgi:hypothetical protein